MKCPKCNSNNSNDAQFYGGRECNQHPKNQKIKTGVLLTASFLVLLLSLSFVIASDETISYSNSSTSFRFVSSSANPDDGRIILTDPSYDYPDFYIWYGGSNQEAVGNWSVYDYALIKNNSDSSWISSVSSKTTTFGYVFIGDYGINNSINGWNRTLWIENKTDIINNWTDTSSDINIFFDLIGQLNDTDSLFNTTLLNNLTNYVHITKSRDTILNINSSFDNLYNYSNYTLRSDICSYWDGSSYVYKDILNDVAIANHYKNNNATLFVSSLGDVIDYEKAYYCYMRNKVIFGDNLIYSYSQKNYSVESEDLIDWNHFKYPNLGSSIDSNYSINEDVYSREFVNGIVSINTTSNTVSYNTDSQINYIQLCAYFEDKDDGASDEGFMHFKINDNMSRYLSVADTDLTQNIKMWKCQNISVDYYEPSGFYELEFYYIDSDGNYLSNFGLNMFHGKQNGTDKVSYYEQTLNDHPSNDETDYVAFERGDNWAVNFTIYRILNTLNLTLINPTNDYNTSNNSINFGATIVSDSYSSVNCNLTINGIINQSNEIFNNNTPKNITVSGFNQGTHTWKYTCWDADAYLVNSETRQFTIDLSPPQLNYHNLSTNTSSVGNIIYVWANFTEAVTEIDSVWLNVNGIVNITNSSNNLNNTLVNFSYVVPNEMELTTINFTISANDSVGNSITTDILDVIIGDSTNPSITLNNPISDYNTSNQNITFNFSVFDSDTDLKCNLSINGTVNQSNISSTNQTIFNHPNLFNEGSYSWNLTCWDSFGNTNNSETRIFNIDTTAPNPPVFTANNLTATPNGFINITWSEVNDASKYLIFKNTSNISEIISNLWIANTTNNYYFDAEVEHNITYWYSIVAVDQLGNYNYQNKSESHNITANDTVKPQNPSNIVIAQSGNTATIQWENITKDIDNMTDTITTYQVWYANTINTSKDYVNETLTFLKNVTNNITTFTITSSKTYYFAITSIDEAGNKNLSLNNNHANQSLTYTAPPDNNEGSSGGSSSSSSGGYIPAVDQNAQTKYMHNIHAGNSTDFEITRENISISKIRLTAKENKSSVGIEVKNINEPQTTKKINKKTYQFLEINPKNIEDNEIEGVEIEFTINNTWIKTNKINKNTVTLLRYVNNTWTELETTLKSSDTKTTIYTAYTPGFSYFAITGEEEKEDITEDTTPEENSTIQELMIQEEQTENTTNETQEQNQSLNTSQKKIPVLLYFIPLFALFIVVLYISIKKLKHKRNKKIKK